MPADVPAGWPAEVQPPGSEDFAASAIAWLYNVAPPGYRDSDIFTRWPAALAALARHHSQASVTGARQGYRVVRTELGGEIPPHAIDSILSAYRIEGKRLAATARAVELVEFALRRDLRESGADPHALARPIANWRELIGPEERLLAVGQRRECGEYSCGVVVFFTGHRLIFLKRPHRRD
jgi:hypothetical protein